MQVLSADLSAVVRSFKSPATKPFRNPSAITADKDDQLVVVEFSSARIVTVSPQGAFVREFKLTRLCDNRPISSYGVALNAAGSELCTSDWSSGRVQVMHALDGTLVRAVRQRREPAHPERCCGECG